MEENNSNKVVSGVLRNVSYTGRVESLNGCDTCVLNDACMFGRCPCGPAAESFVDIHLKLEPKRLQGKQRNIIFDGLYVDGDSCSMCVLNEACPFEVCPFGVGNGYSFIDVNLKQDKSFLE